MKIERLLQLYPNSYYFDIIPTTLKKRITVMLYRLSLVSVLMSGLLILSSCQSNGSPHYKEGYLYRSIYFGKGLSPNAKRGIRDGCETSRGIYTKSYELFNNDNDYYNGWFTGRNRCRGLLKIDADGNLIL